MFRGALCNPADDSPLPAMFGVNPLGVTFFSVGGREGRGGREVGLGGVGESRRCSLRVGAPRPPTETRSHSASSSKQNRSRCFGTD